MNDQAKKEFLRLVDATSGDRGEESEHRKVSNALRSNPEALKVYVQYRDMHANLCTQSLADDCDDGTCETALASADKTGHTSQGLAQKLIGGSSFLAIAASLLLVVVAFWSGSRWAENSDVAPSAALNINELSELDYADVTLMANNPSVARVTGLVDCLWEENQQPLHFGKPIVSGEQLEFSAGLLQLTFDSGAKVIVQGPASFTPQSAMEAELDYGKLAAVVSESARGYTVKTPTAEIVDLGTEFALEVENNGITELHVLEGDVVARPRGSNGELRGEAVHVQKLDALRFVYEKEVAERISAEPEKFARQITPKLTKEQLPPLPVADGLKFWVAADLLVSRGKDGTVSAWRDVCIGDNQISNDACQFSDDEQPVWIADAGFGMPAIRFNGATTRLTTDPFSTGDQVCIFVVCAPSESGQNNTKWGGQLLNFGGKAPTVEMAIQHDQFFYSGLWAANAVGAKITTGTISRHNYVESGVPNVLCYSYDAIANQAEQWVNGVSKIAVQAPLSLSTYSARTIGGHGNPENNHAFFRGHMFEVLIYDKALNDYERQSVTDYLLTRYRID